MPYVPREDSLMLLEQVRKYAFGDVLDMGTGSGIQAIAASKRAKSVMAVDIDRDALEEAKRNAKKERARIHFARSDLFSNVKKKFDVIIFNPPYLPQDRGIVDPAIYGGGRGYETIQRFIESVNGFLKENGIILLLFSSLSKKDKVDSFIEDAALEKELLDEKPFFFEKLYVYKIEKSPLLKRLEKLNFRNVARLAKGHRGIIYTATWKGKKVAVKAQRPDSAARNRMENEAKWLKILNRKGIAPRLLLTKGDFFAYEFAEGDFILDFVRKSSREKILKVLGEVLQQCRILDTLHVTKEEMHHPLKHIIVGRKTILLDFERAHYDEFPKNVTQFCQFLISSGLSGNLKKKGRNIDREKIIALLKTYKNHQSEDNFGKIRDDLINLTFHPKES